MRSYRVIVSIVSLFFIGALSVNAQMAPSPDTNDVVKITTKLVQMDVTVVDKQGRPVSGLNINDFELLQDGKRQKLVGLTYVRGDGELAPTTAPASNSSTAGLPSTAAAREVTSNRRIIAFLVDDGTCSASTWGIDTAKVAITRFIKEQMRPEDLVAIYRTRAGSSAFQQYSSDKATLLKAAEKIRWYPPQGSCAITDGSFNERARSNDFGKPTGTGSIQTVTVESAADRQTREYREDAIANLQTVGTLGVFRYAVSGLERAAGRKVMFLMSDGIQLRNRQNQRLSSSDAMRELTDEANRAGVVVHSIYLRGGGVSGMIEARDEVITDDFATTELLSRTRVEAESRNEEGLSAIASATGGEMFRGVQIPDKVIGRFLARNASYYLLAYEPEDETFKGKKFNRIEVRVNKPGLSVVHRSGFLGVADKPAGTKPAKSAESDLYEAIAAPLPGPGLGIDLSAYFVNTSAGNFVRSLFHIDGKDLIFTDESGGQKKAVIDVVAVTMDEKNDVVDEFTRTHTLKFDAATAARVHSDGLIYSADVPVKKSGSYNFRVAVRDGGSRLVGTAAQIVQVPDLKRGDLLVTGLTLSGVDRAGKFETVGPATAANALSLPVSNAAPAIRRFRAGDIVAYAYSVYNARLDQSKKPNLSVEVNMFRDGKLVVDGAPTPVKIDQQSDLNRLSDYGYFRLDKDAGRGEYSLQIIVQDVNGGKNAFSSQSLDFVID